MWTSSHIKSCAHEESDVNVAQDFDAIDVAKAGTLDRDGVLELMTMQVSLCLFREPLCCIRQSYLISKPLRVEPRSILVAGSFVSQSGHLCVCSGVPIVTLNCCMSCVSLLHHIGWPLIHSSMPAAGSRSFRARAPITAVGT